MKLIGDLKKNVEKAADLKEAKEIIREAGVELTDEELEQVAGGITSPTPQRLYYSGSAQ